MSGGPERVAVSGQTGGGSGHTSAPSWPQGSSITVSGTQNHAMLIALQAVGAPVPTITRPSGTLPPNTTFAAAANGYGTVTGTPASSASANSFVMRASNGIGSPADITVNYTVASDVVVDPHVYTVPTGTGWTDGTDVTTKLLGFFNTVPDGTNSTPNIIRFPTGFTWKVEGRLYMQSRNNLVFDGTGAKIVRTGGGRVDNFAQGSVLNCDIFTFNCGSNIVVYGLEIQQGNSTADYFIKQETQHCIRFRGVIGAEVSNCVFHHTFGDGVYVGFGQVRAATHVQAEKIWVHDNEVHHSGRQALSPSIGVRDTVFENNYLHDTRRAAVDIEPLAVRGDVLAYPDSRDADVAGLNGAYNIHILDNRMDSVGLSCMAHKGSGYAHTIVWKGNYTTNTKFDGYWGASDIGSGVNRIAGPARYGLWIHDNVFDVNPSSGDMTIVRYHGIDIRNNTIMTQGARLRETSDFLKHPKFDPSKRTNPVIGRDPNYAVNDPAWTTDTRIQNYLFEINYCSGIAVASNDCSPATGPNNGAAYISPNTPGSGGPAPDAAGGQGTNTPGTNIATTAPTPPDAGAAFARRSTGGWTP